MKKARIYHQKTADIYVCDAYKIDKTGGNLVKAFRDGEKIFESKHGSNRLPNPFRCHKKPNG